MPQGASRAAVGAGIRLSLAPRAQPSSRPMGPADQAPNGSGTMLRPAVINVLIGETSEGGPIEGRDPERLEPLHRHDVRSLKRQRPETINKESRRE
eukprot:8351838-Pyramimonas_sp.AAC.1